jgi:hypothetical protein
MTFTGVRLLPAAAVARIVELNAGCSGKPNPPSGLGKTDTVVDALPAIDAVGFTSRRWAGCSPSRGLEVGKTDVAPPPGTSPAPAKSSSASGKWPTWTRGDRNFPGVGLRRDPRMGAKIPLAPCAPSSARFRGDRRLPTPTAPRSST